MKIAMCVVQGRPSGKRLEFPLGDYYIGRGSECHVRPNSDMVSRQHCLLRVQPNAAVIRDLGSRNGTLVNGVRVVGECPLLHGDLVAIGPLIFEVRFDALLPTAPPAAAGSGDDITVDLGAQPANPSAETVTEHHEADAVRQFEIDE
jgi:pSer/pThr/pTyr-binding forkhead associated (FHA) protein